MHIVNVKSADELDRVLRLTHEIFPQLANMASGEKYSRAFWLERMHEAPELLLYATDGETICGSVFGWIDDAMVTVGHCWVGKEHREQGIGRALILEVERRTRDRGCRGVALGAVESAEGFYEKLGYTGTLLVQSDNHSVEELLKL